MPLSTADFVLGVLLPAITAVLVMASLRRWEPDWLAKQWMPNAAFTAGVVLAYLAVGLSPIRPTLHWHWVLHVVIGAFVVSSTVAAMSVTGIWKWVSYAGTTFAAALVLVPTWSDLEPSRWIYIVIWTCGALLATWLYDWTAKELSSVILALVTTITFVAAATLLGFSGNLRFAQMALAGAGSLAGITLTLAIRRTPFALNGIALTSCMLLTSVLLVGQVNSFTAIPATCYAVLPFAPALGAIATIGGPQAHWGDRRKKSLQLIAPIILCVVVVAIGWRG